MAYFGMTKPAPLLGARAVEGVRNGPRGGGVTAYQSLEEVERYTHPVCDERQKRLGPRPLGYFARFPSRRAAILAPVGQFKQKTFQEMVG